MRTASDETNQFAFPLGSQTTFGFPGEPFQSAGTSGELWVTRMTWFPRPARTEHQSSTARTTPPSETITSGQYWIIRSGRGVVRELDGAGFINSIPVAKRNATEPRTTDV